MNRTKAHGDWKDKKVQIRCTSNWSVVLRQWGGEARGEARGEDRKNRGEACCFTCGRRGERNWNEFTRKGVASFRLQLPFLHPFTSFLHINKRPVLFGNRLRFYQLHTAFDGCLHLEQVFQFCGLTYSCVSTSSAHTVDECENFVDKVDEKLGRNRWDNVRLVSIRQD